MLSDPHERKWYDDHREEILNPRSYGDGDSDDEEGRGRTVNLTSFFRCVHQPNPLTHRTLSDVLKVALKALQA